MIKRIKRRVPSTSQRALFPEQPVEPRTSGARGHAQFMSMDRSHLFVGDERLDSYLRRAGLGDVVELAALVASIDVEPFRAHYRGTGRAPHHPHAMLGLIAYGVAKGLSSLRELEQLAIIDVGAWWLCAGHQPDHSAIGRFIQRHKKHLSDAVFEEATRLALNAVGATSEGSVAVDGTVVEAATSRLRTLTSRAIAAQLETGREEMAAHPDDPSREKLVEKLEHADAVSQERAQKRVAAGKSNSVRVSPDEPEAVNQPLKNNLRRASYKPTVAVQEQGFIVGQTVVPSHEGSAVPTVIEQSTRCLGRVPERVLLDAGYFDGTTLTYFVDREIDVLCAPGPPASKRAKNPFSKQHFEYDEDNDIYRCPVGEELVRIETYRASRGGDVVRYRCSAFARCGHHSQCTSSPRGRRLTRYEHEALKETMRVVFKDPRAQAEYRKRAPLAETPFATLKNVQGLTRFRRRGTEGAKLEMSIHCIAHNLGKAASRVLALILLRWRGRIVCAAVVIM